MCMCRYLQRNSTELMELESCQSDPHTAAHYRQQHASREDAVRMLIEKEREMLEGPGFGMANEDIILSVSS